MNWLGKVNVNIFTGVVSGSCQVEDAQESWGQICYIEDCEYDSIVEQKVAMKKSASAKAASASKTAVELVRLCHPPQRGHVNFAWCVAFTGAIGSTWEEAYSLAIVLKETMESLSLSGNKSVQIFATDLDAETVSKARTGLFLSNIAANAVPHLRQSN